MYLTKKDSVNKLPGNYETGLLNTWQPGFNEFFGCINIKSVGFDFSQGRQESDLTKADIILDINCTTLTFNNFEKKLDNANIMALGNAGIVDMGNQHTFYSLVNAPKEGYMLKVPLEQSHKYYIRTREGNYAKIEIYWTESSFSDSGYFVKFPIFWAYQSDGSTNLAVEDSYALPFFVKSTCSTFSFTP